MVNIKTKIVFFFFLVSFFFLRMYTWSFSFSPLVSIPPSARCFRFLSLFWSALSSVFYSTSTKVRVSSYSYSGWCFYGVLGVGGSGNTKRPNSLGRCSRRPFKFMARLLQWVEQINNVLEGPHFWRTESSAKSSPQALTEKLACNSTLPDYSRKELLLLRNRTILLLTLARKRRINLWLKNC